MASEFTIEGEEHLSDLDDARRDSVVRLLTSLGEIPSSRRMGKFSSRFGSRVWTDFESWRCTDWVRSWRWLQVVVVMISR